MSRGRWDGNDGSKTPDPKEYMDRAAEAIDQLAPPLPQARSRLQCRFVPTQPWRDTSQSVFLEGRGTGAQDDAANCGDGDCHDETTPSGRSVKAMRTPPQTLPQAHWKA